MDCIAYPYVMLILASGSQSRHQILTQMEVPFQVIVSNIDETPLKSETPSCYVQRISRQKAVTIADKHPGRFVLAADTMIAVGRRILVKAEDQDEAISQMRLLSGRSHRVYTHVTLMRPDRQIFSRLCMTRVRFKVLQEFEIQGFIASQEWRNVAVYQYQGYASRFIQSIQGLPSTIQGLPVIDTYHLLTSHQAWQPVRNTSGT